MAAQASKQSHEEVYRGNDHFSRFVISKSDSTAFSGGESPALNPVEL